MRSNVFPTSLRLLPLLCLAALSPVTARAQDAPPAGRFGEEIAVEKVVLDVQVTDRRGNLVLGLGPEDFVVTEDGERMQVEDVTFYSSKRFLESAELAEELGVDRGAIPDVRYFVLFFHDVRRIFPRLGVQQLAAGRDAKRWVRGLEPGDRVAVVSFGSRLLVHQDFTGDEDELADAIDDAVIGRETPAHEARSEGEPAMLPHLPPPDDLGDETSRIYSALGAIARGTAHLPGRKNLVLFSIGFGEPNVLGFYEPDRRFYPRLERALNDANIAVYPIDLMPTSAFGLARNELLGNSLNIVADDTGGRYYYNFVSFGAPLDEIEAENSGYYLIAYDSPHPRGETGYQEVEVDTTNPELSVRSRQGYVFGEPF